MHHSFVPAATRYTNVSYWHSALESKFYEEMLLDKLGCKTVSIQAIKTQLSPFCKRSTHHFSEEKT
jgi:hypothetical protein